MSMNASPFLSIVTPTYNRGHLLPRCCESLQSQTDKDFEWIIVDDGSLDNTETVVHGFSASDFPVIYVKKENGGKHTALNASHPFIHGRYVLILDSDDYLIPTAVEQVKKAWSRFSSMTEIGIVTFLKGNNKGDPMCTAPTPNVPVNILRYKRNIIYINDCCETIRKELFLQYPFPVYPGENFISECALWNRVDKTHKCVYINEVIYICEYLEGGLTDAGRGLRIRNPRGGMFISNLRMDKRNYLSQRFKYGLLYTCYGFFAKFSFSQILFIDNGNLWLKVLCLIPGYCLYILWKTKFGK